MRVLAERLWAHFLNYLNLCEWGGHTYNIHITHTLLLTTLVFIHSIMLVAAFLLPASSYSLSIVVVSYAFIFCSQNRERALTLFALCETLFEVRSHCLQFNLCVCVFYYCYCWHLFSVHSTQAKGKAVSNVLSLSSVWLCGEWGREGETENECKVWENRQLSYTLI